MAFRTELVIGESHVLSKILILLSIVCHDMQGFVSGSQAGPHDSWPFSDLNAININVHGNVINTTSPVGQGLYLDGSSNTYVEIKGYNSSCMDDASKCDLTIGFFFKYTSHSQNSKETYFGNKDNNEDLYRGINIHFNESGPHHEYNMSVYGKDRYCECRIYPFYGVWQYIGLIWEKPGNLTVYHDGWITHAYQNPKRCTCCQSPNGLKTGRYYLGKDTFPNAYYKDLVIWYSKQERTVLDERWYAPFDNGGDTEITLKIDFWELPYDASKANQWENSFNNTVRLH
ncbi:uncharacterized protein [Montipora foliosa]|uniref:uncharacterized protein n=1 Tax=Montipora foliosa TaxID=591990 RepID=UPI0035F153D2